MQSEITSETRLRVVTPNPDENECPATQPVVAPNAMSLLPRLTAYRDGAVNVEALVSSCVMAGMMCFICLLFAAILEPWVAV